MTTTVRGVALIVQNPDNEILILQEFVNKPHLGKLSGMFSIPMETSLPDESDMCALKRLEEEELAGFPSLQLPGNHVGAYRIVDNVWVKLYAIRTAVATLPQAPARREVGNYQWNSIEAAQGLWLRRGALEMLEDFAAGRTGVTRDECSPPISRSISRS